MGSLWSRSGILYLDFRFRGQRCRETSGLSDTPSNRKKCDKLLSRIEAEITLGTFEYDTYFPGSGRAELFQEMEQKREAAITGVPRFQDFTELWFAEKRVEWRDSHANTIRLTLDNHILPRFGCSYLTEVSKADLLSFRGYLSTLPGKGGRLLSPTRINKIMMPIRMILTEAADRHEFQNPWRNIKPLKEQRSEVDPFSLQEVNDFLAAVRPDMRQYYIIRFFTGMRTSEIDALKWVNVDFDRQQILVREALVQGKFVPTKTDGSNRAIEMNSLVCAALKVQYEATGDWSDFVFSTRNGTPYNARNIAQRVWYPTLRFLRLRERRPYQTRHTAATLWLASGENPEWIARQMGHTTTQMLFTVYSRYVPNLTRKDGSAFEALLAERFSD